MLVLSVCIPLYHAPHYVHHHTFLCIATPNKSNPNYKFKSQWIPSLTVPTILCILIVNQGQVLVIHSRIIEWRRFKKPWLSPTLTKLINLTHKGILSLFVKQSIIGRDEQCEHSRQTYRQGGVTVENFRLYICLVLMLQPRVLAFFMTAEFKNESVYAIYTTRFEVVHNKTFSRHFGETYLPIHDVSIQ